MPINANPGFIAYLVLFVFSLKSVFNCKLIMLNTEFKFDASSTEVSHQSPIKPLKPTHLEM